MTTARALMGHLCAELAAASPGCRWVMSARWRDDVKRAEGYCGDALLIPSPGGREFLSGFPVEVREDGGVPHLVPP